MTGNESRHRVGKVPRRKVYDEEHLKKNGRLRAGGRHEILPARPTGLRERVERAIAGGRHGPVRKK